MMSTGSRTFHSVLLDEHADLDVAFAAAVLKFKMELHESTMRREGLVLYLGPIKKLNLTEKERGQ
jgi:hypothetical protein